MNFLSVAFTAAESLSPIASIRAMGAGEGSTEYREHQHKGESDNLPSFSTVASPDGTLRRLVGLLEPHPYRDGSKSVQVHGSLWSLCLNSHDIFSAGTTSTLQSRKSSCFDDKSSLARCRATYLPDN